MPEIIVKMRVVITRKVDWETAIILKPININKTPNQC